MEAVLAHRQPRIDADVEGLAFGQPSPPRRSCEQVADRVHLLRGAERVVEAGQPASQRQQRAARRVEAGRVVLRERGFSRGHRLHTERILQSRDRRKVIGVARVYEDPRAQQDVLAAELLRVEPVLAGIVQNSRDVVILVDRHDGQVALAWIGERDRRSSGDVHDSEAVERVPVHPDHGLFVDRSGNAVVPPAVDAAGGGEHRREHAMGLRAGEVLDVDDDRRHDANYTGAGAGGFLPFG